MDWGLNGHVNKLIFINVLLKNDNLPNEISKGELYSGSQYRHCKREK